MVQNCIIKNANHQPIYFITSNPKKFTSLKNLLSPLGIDLRQLEYDFDEGRDLDIRKIAEAKLAQAKRAFPGKQLIVDDRGFFIPALKGFPGPFVKLVLDSFSHEGLVKLMRGESAGVMISEINDWTFAALLC